MDYFQGVVSDYLRAKRSVFINTEFMISLDAGGTPRKGRHWYCDAVAVDFKDERISLCEITYSATLQAVVDRLASWQSCWTELIASVCRDTGVPPSWEVIPWVFLPKKYEPEFHKKLAARLKGPALDQPMPKPRVTHLEATLPWEYLVTWDRQVDHVTSAA